MDPRRRKRGHFAGPFFGIEHGVLRSPAFIHCSGPAWKLLTAVCARHDGSNNGQISFSVREAAQLLNGNKNTAAKQFHELIDLGFLGIGSKGAFSVKYKLATTWRITLFPCNGQASTRDYQHWRPQPAVSPTDTEAHDDKQNTVSPRDIHGTSQRYRPAKKELKNGLSVIARDTELGSQGAVTVPPRDTHIDLAIGCRDAATIEATLDRIARQVRVASS